MRVKGTLIILIISLILALPQFAMAVKVHDGGCKTCHLQGYSINEIGGANVCLQCHSGTGTPSNKFSEGDASDHYGNNQAAVNETSHNWSAASSNAAAGAAEPLRIAGQMGFFSRYGTTMGKVACSRCHNPHGEIENNPKLLAGTAYGFTAAPMEPNDMCVACHKPFADSMQADHGLLSHPMIDDYETFASGNPDYKTGLAVYNSANPYAAGVQLVDGKVTCLTCHGLHYTDSNAGTADGPGIATAGDGLLLRGNGINFTNGVGYPDSSTSVLCNTCHNYEAHVHGTSDKIGCIACHGGHEYNDGTPNVYMLNDPTGSYAIDPSTIASLDRSVAWGGSGAGVDGFCENCHGDIEAGGWDSIRDHSSNLYAEDCTTCHTDHSSGSFSEPLGCDGCHGNPPSNPWPGNEFETGVVEVYTDKTGYAWAPTGSGLASPYSYQYSDGDTNTTTQPFYKNEAQTPHTSHSGASSNYGYQCRVCHNTHIDNFAGTHNVDNGSFQDVLEAASPFDSRVKIATEPNPSYVGVATGTCSAVYCHSNGGVNDGTGTRTYTYASPQWDDGPDTTPGAKGSIVGKAGYCSACHGNSAATMDSNNHAPHLNYGYSCNVCHVTTATSDSDLVGALNSPPVTHINQTLNVSFDSTSALKGGSAVTHGGTPYSDAANMTCSAVYCHSSGQSIPGDRTYQSVNWDDAGSMTCTSCHNVPSASSTAAHTAHVNGSGSDVGRNLDCAVCHDDTMDAGNNGALGAGGAAFHVNGVVNINMSTALDSGNCSNISCHSDGNLGGTMTYNNPAWTSTPNLGCDDCHGDGAGKSYPTYASGAAGSEDANSHFKHADATESNIACDECHSATSASGTALDGTDSTQHVDQTIDVNFKQGGTWDGSDTNKTCSSTACHVTGTPQWGGVVNCGDCHAVSNAGGSALADSHGAHYEATTAGTFAETNTSAAGTYQINCGVCHSTNQGTQHAGGDANANYAAEVNFDGTVAEGTATYTPGGTFVSDPNGFDFSNATCASLYCHGDFGGNGNASTPVWNDPTTGECGDCHDVDSTATMTGGSHQVHVKGPLALTCDYCHGATAVNEAGGIARKDLHVNQQLEMQLDAAKNVFTASSTYNAVNSEAIAKGDVGGPYDSCNNVYCHSDVQPDGGTGAPTAYATPTWGGTANCGTCHNTGAAQTTGSHTRHFSDYSIGCGVCHVQGGTSNAANHADYDVNVDIVPAWGGTYNYNAGSLIAPGDAYTDCSNVTCHSNGQSGAARVDNTPLWGANIGNCVSCHEGATAGTDLSGAHESHIVNAGTTIGGNLTCNICHPLTASDNSTIATNAEHVVDNAVDVISCATHNCHSDGNFGADLTYKPPTWTATYDCDDCHGDAAGKAYPTYANGGVGDPSANSHPAHMVGGGLACGDCHKQTSTVGTSIDGTAPAQHVDGGIDVSGDEIGGFAGGTCSTITCHGNNNADWGDSLGCSNCHTNATTDTDNFTYNDGTVAVIALDEWTYSGHGLDVSGSYQVTGRSGADFENKASTGDACLYCHDSSVSHGDANYFRLRDNAMADLNGACLKCHASSETGMFDPDGAGAMTAYNTATIVKVDKYHGGADHNGTDRDDGRWCWDCHDPHGDADAANQRIQMVQRFPHNDPNAFGVPAGLQATEVIFYDNTIGVGAGAFARDITGAGAAAGICNSCHTVTDQYTQTTGKGTHPSSTCTDCHKHSEDTTYDGLAFAGSGCNGCHGGSYDHSNNTFDNTNYWPDSVGGNAEDDDARHTKHMTELAAAVYSETLEELLDTANGDPDAKQKALCLYCHDTPGGANHLSGLPADVNSMYRIWNYGAGADDGVYATANGGTCATVDCHNNKTTTTTAGDDYAWYGADTTNCVMCHVDVPTDGTSHTVHISGLYSQIGCNDCHVGTPTWVDDATQSAPTVNHINGTFLVTSTDRTFTYNSGTGSCGTNECHNDGNMGAPNTTPYDWAAGDTSAHCQTCHDTLSPVMLTEGHKPHMDAAFVNSTEQFVGSAFSCSACHGHSSGSDANHLSNAVNFDAAITYSGNVDINVSASYGNCTTTLCHNAGDQTTAVPTPQWDRTPSSADDCSLCHTNAGLPDSHGAHINNVSTTTYVSAQTNKSIAGEYRFDCGLCHGATVGNHIDGNPDFVDYGGYGVATDWDGAACNNNACHQSETGGAANLSANWATGWVSDVDGDTCNNCHGNSPTTNAHGVHEVGIHYEELYDDDGDGLMAAGYNATLLTASSGADAAHGNAGTSDPISCQTCHNSTVTVEYNAGNETCNNCHSDTNTIATGNEFMVIADKSAHVDGSKDVSFGDLTTFKSKAQLRNDLSAADDGSNILSELWVRMTTSTSYKASDGSSYDVYNSATTSYNATTMTCSTAACHNGIDVAWNKEGNIVPATYAPDCSACHTSLPK